MAAAKVDIDGALVPRIAMLLRKNGEDAIFNVKMTIADLATATTEGRPAVIGVKTYDQGDQLLDESLLLWLMKLLKSKG